MKAMVIPSSQPAVLIRHLRSAGFTRGTIARADLLGVNVKPGLGSGPAVVFFNSMKSGVRVRRVTRGGNNQPLGMRDMKVEVRGLRSSALGLCDILNAQVGVRKNRLVVKIDRRAEMRFATL